MEQRGLWNLEGIMSGSCLMVIKHILLNLFPFPGQQKKIVPSMH